MRSVPAAALAAACLTVSACIPERNNPLDPAGAPDAVLQFADGGPGIDGFTCALTVGSAGIVTLLELPRGRCLALVGRSSTDPQDDSEGLRYEFRYQGEALEQPDGDDSIDHILLDQATVIGLPAEEVLTFELKVTDADGNYNVTDAQVRILNELPVPQFLPPRTIPAGGYPWAPGEPIAVSFVTGTSGDPDGVAPTEYCWTFSTIGEVCSESADDASFVVDIDPTSSSRRFAAELRVKDDVGTSEPRTAVVNIAEPNLWLGGFAGLRRVDTSLETTFIPGAAAAGAGRLALVPSDGISGPRVAAFFENAGGGDSLTVLELPDVPTSALDVEPIVDAGQVALAAAPDGTRLWTLGTSGDEGILRRWDLSGIALTPQAPVTVPMPSEGVGLLPVVDVDEAGRVWASRRHGDVYAFDGTATPLAVFVDDSGRQVQSIEHRPGTDEAWFLRTVPPSVSSIASATLHRIVATEDGVGGTTFQEQSFNLESPNAVDMAWVGTDKLWIGLADRLALVDVDVLVQTADLELATIRDVPGVATALRVVADAQTGDAWAFAITYSAHASVDGTVRFHPTAFDVIPEFIDDDGLLWTNAAGGLGLLRYRVPPNDVALSLPQSAVFSGTSDWMGGLWLMRGDLFQTPSALVHVAEDGTIDAFHSTARTENGASFSMPMLGTLRTVPGDSTTAYAIFFDIGDSSRKSIQRVDLGNGSEPPVLATVLGSSSAGSFVYPILEPSAPLPASTPFLWTAADSGSNLADVGQMDPVTGLFTPRVTLSDANLALARSLHSNGACVGARTNGATDTIRARWITAAGAVTTLQDVAIADVGGRSSLLAGVAVSRDSADAANDLCWIAWNEPQPTTDPCVPGASQIRAYAPAGGAAVATYAVSPAGRVLSIKPLDRDRLWVFVERCEPGFTDPVGYLEYVSRVSGVFTPQFRYRVGTSSNEDGFADPEVSFEGIDFIF